MGADCTYCGSDVYEHDALFVEKEEDGDREQTGQFCNYACLSEHIDEENLAVGNCCTLDL